jgi:hypothetical protein
MIPRIPYIFASGETLTLEKVKTNLLRLHKDFTYSADRNINLSHFIIPFSGVVAATPAAVSTYRFRSPSDLVIIGTEIQVHGAAATTTVTLTSTSGTFISHAVNTLAADPADTRYTSFKEQSVIFTTGGTADFIITASGTNTSINVVVYYKQARYIKNDLTATFSPELDSSTTLATAASRINSSLSTWGTRITSNQTSNKDSNFEIYRIFGDATVPLIRAMTYIPCELRTIDGLNVSVVCAAGTNLRAQLTSAAGTGASLLYVDVNGAGVATFAEAFSDTDAVSAVSSDDDFTDSTKDTRLEIARIAGAGNILCSYVTIVYR